MPTGQVNTVLGFIRNLSEADATRKLPDRELVRQFASRRDDAAFRALVRRHGAMVFRLCSRVLQSNQDAEDVFQATFLVLAKKAGAVQRRDSIGSWLYGVAFRLATKMKTAAARRRTKEARAEAKHQQDVLAAISAREAQDMLDQELARLPDKYRAPLILCCVEGLARDEAAHQLAWPLRAVKNRLEQARLLLRARLARRGLTLSGALLLSVLCEQVGKAALSGGLIRSTVKAATTVAAGGAATSIVSPKVAALTEGALQAMCVTNLKMAAILFSAIAAIGIGTACIVNHGQAYGPFVRQVAQAESNADPGKAKKQDDGTKKPASVLVQPKKLLEESFQATGRMTYPTDRMVLLLSIARARARVGDQPGVAKAIEEALRIAGSLRDEDRPPISKSHSLTSIAVAQSEVGDFAGARKTIEQITGLDGETDIALAALAEHQARTGDIKGAVRTASAIRQDAQKTYALKGIVTRQAEASDVKGALATARTIKEDLKRVEALVAVARVQFRKGEAAAAKERFLEARQVADNTKSGLTGQEPTLALLEVADALAEIGDKQGALRITKEVQDSKVLPAPTDPLQSTGHWRLALVQCKAGDFKGARRTAESIEDRGMQSRTWYHIALVQMKAGDVAAGTKTIEMVSEDWQKSYLQMELAKALARKGDREGASAAFQQALSFVERDPEPPHPRLTKLLHLKWLVKEQALAGHEKEAMTWIESQTSPELRAAALLGLAKGLLDRDKETNKGRDK